MNVKNEIRQIELTKSKAKYEPNISIKLLLQPFLLRFYGSLEDTYIKLLILHCFFFSCVRSSIPFSIGDQSPSFGFLAAEDFVPTFSRYLSKYE